MNYPMTQLFWYPTASWRANEIVVAKTVPLQRGSRVRLGVGVAGKARTGATGNRAWPITRVDPLTLTVHDGVWVDLGEFVPAGKGYRKE